MSQGLAGEKIFLIPKHFFSLVILLLLPTHLLTMGIIRVTSTLKQNYSFGISVSEFILCLCVSPSACKSANIDLVFLIDGSKSVRPQNFELVKKFVNQVGQDLIMYSTDLK